MNNKIGIQFNKEDFSNPKREYNVTYSWTWNTTITKEGIDRELAEFVKAGVKSFYVLPLPKDFRPESLRTFLHPEYLSEGFFELVKYAMERAKALGMFMWIYDEGGWPSGGACGNTLRENDDAAFELMKSRKVRLSCGDTYEISADGLALYEGCRRISGKFTAKNDTVLDEIYCERFVNNGNRADVTKASVTETFLNNTYEAYKSHVGNLFGSDLPLIFTDEPGVFPNIAPNGIFEEFEKEYGYDVRDYLYAILDDTGESVRSEAEIRARIDYGRLLGALFRRNFFEKAEEWCEKNGVYFSGHIDIDNRPYGGYTVGYFSLIDVLRHMHVPGIDVIWEQIRYPYGNREPLDDETRGFGYFPLLAASAARQRGANLALTENLSIYGDGVTPDDIKYSTNYQIMRGINVLNFLTLPYGKTRMEALMMRPAFCLEKPGFFNLKQINSYYSRLSYLSRLGEREGDTALFYQAADYFADSDWKEKADSSIRKIGTELEMRNIPFDIIDEYGIRDAEITSEGLKLGAAIYKHIVMPETKYTPQDVIDKISKFKGEGTPIIKCKSQYLRFMTRKLDSGRLWFIFNEGESTVTEKLNIGGGKNIYRLSLHDGEMYRENDVTPTLLCGDIAVYLVTDDEYPTESCDVEYSIEISKFTPVRYKRFNIAYTGISAEYGEGSVIVDDSFSGEVTYAADYELKETPSANDRYRISVEDTAVSACLRCGDNETTFAIKPMSKIVNGDFFDKAGRLEFTVANTAANEILAKQDIIESHPAAEVGGYAERMYKFEARKPKLKLGKIIIEKLK